MGEGAGIHIEAIPHTVFVISSCGLLYECADRVSDENPCFCHLEEVLLGTGQRKATLFGRVPIMAKSNPNELALGSRQHESTLRVVFDVAHPAAHSMQRPMA